MKPIVFYPERRYLAKLYLGALPLSLFLLVWGGGLVNMLLRVPGDSGTILGGLLATYFVVWIVFVWLHYRSFRYEVTDDDMTTSSGVLSKSTRHIRYQGIVDIQVSRDITDRLLGIGTLHVRVGGSALPAITMAGVGDIDGLFNFVVEAMRSKQDALLEQQERLSLDQQDILLDVVDELRAMRTGEALPEGEDMRPVRKLKAGKG